MSLNINKTHTLALTRDGDIVVRVGSSSTLVIALAARRIDAEHGRNAFDRLQDAALRTNLQSGSETYIVLEAMKAASSDINAVITAVLAGRKAPSKVELYNTLIRQRSNEKYLNTRHESSRIAA